MEGNFSGKSDPVIRSITPRQPVVSKKVILLTPPSARYLMIPRVQQAAKGESCLGSTWGGNSPGAGGASGPVATALKRGLSVTGETTRASPGKNSAALFNCEGM